MSIARTKYKVTKSMLMLGILTTGLLSGFIALIAYFGQNMGTFVISGTPEATQVGITLSDDPNFLYQSSRLLVKPANNSRPTTFQEINFAGGVSTNGDYDGDINFIEDEKIPYIAYTFYLKNDGNYAVDINFDIEITAATNKIDKVMRLAILEDAYVDSDNNIKMSAGYLYFKDENNVNQEAFILMEDTPHEKVFNDLRKYSFSDKQVNSDYKIENFRPSQVKKYSIFIWLEGWDNDSGNIVSRGQLKMRFTFSVSKIIEE